MDSLSWSDGCLHFFKSCFSCLALKSRNNDAIASGSYHYEGLRSRGHNDFESLLRDPTDSEPDADTMSLHSNIGDGSTSRIGRKRTKKRTKRRGMSIFGFNVFGRPPLQLPVSEDDDDFPAPLEHSRRKRSSSNYSSSTLDSDAAPLRPEDIARLTSEPLPQPDDIEQDRRSERRRRRQERKLAAQALAMSANRGEFEGFQGSGGDELFSSNHLSEPNLPAPIPTSTFSPSSLYGQAARLFEAYVQSATSGLPSASSSDEQGEYGIVDDAPDFDADNYSRSTAGSRSSASGSGSHSHSHSSQSQASYEHSHDTQYVYNHHYSTRAQLSPQTPMTLFDVHQPQVSHYFPAENGGRHLPMLKPMKPKKPRNISRKLSSSSSQSPSIASPSPIYPAFTPLTTIRVEDNEPPSFALAEHANNVNESMTNELHKGSS